MVLKDRFSVRWIHEEAVFGSVSYAYTPDDLASKVRERLKKAGDVLLQEFVKRGNRFLVLASRRQDILAICMAPGMRGRPTWFRQ